ncbi:hypothetical protein CGT98_18845 [Vibrio metoecus]|nr:hypothetical protein CGT98_18845 [Vibrio metoecus]
MFQIVDIVHKTILITMFSIVSMAIQLYVCVIYFEFGLYGYALAVTTNSLLMVFVNMCILTLSSSIKIQYMKLLLDVIPIVVLMALSNYIYAYIESSFAITRLFIKLFIWALLVIACYLMLFPQIKKVLGK